MAQPHVMILLGLAATAAFLFANALFVAAEYALVKLRASRVKELVNKGDRAALTVQKLQKDMGTTIAGTQLGITLASLAIGWIGQETVHSLVVSLLNKIPGLEHIGLPVWSAFIVSFIILSMLHVIVGEQVAKSWALRLPEATALRLSGLLNKFCWLTYPLLWVMNTLARLVLKILRLPEQTSEQYTVHSPEEFELLFEASRRAGQLDATSTDLLQRALDLHELTAKQVMVPRTKMVAIADSLNLQEVLAVVSAHKKTRLLVYKGNDDNVIGLLNVLDLFDIWAGKENNHASTAAPGEAGTAGSTGEFRLASLLRPVQFVPDSMQASKILADMRAKNYQVAIVLDEFGGTDGVITVKDLVEQLVGEIWEESDAPNPGVREIAEGRWQVKGDLTLLEVKNELGAVLEGWSSITVGGAVTEHLGRQPEVGDGIESNGFTYKVAEMNHRVISLLEVARATALTAIAVNETTKHK